MREAVFSELSICQVCVYLRIKYASQVERSYDYRSRFYVRRLTYSLNFVVKFFLLLAMGVLVSIRYKGCGVSARMQR